MTYFWNYRLEKAGLIKCIKSSLLENLRTVNALIGPKHCLNQHGRGFIIFFDDFERKLVRKILS